MKLLLCDDRKINTYILKNSSENSFVIDYYCDDDVYETITLKNIDNNWSIENNINIEIISNNKPSYSEYDSVKLRISSINKEISLYFLPFIEEYYDISLNNIDSLKAGTSNDSNIVVNSTNDIKEFFEILRVENEYYIKPLYGQKLYVNNYIVEVSDDDKGKKLKGGDIIFCEGIKIIWILNFFMINKQRNLLNFNNLFTYTRNTIDYNYTSPNEYEKNLKLYSENQVFFHTPRLQMSLANETVKIDPPPDQQRDETMPLYITLGSSIILCLTSFASGISAVRELSKGGDKTSIIIEIVISAAMLIVSLFIPVMTNRWQKKAIRDKGTLRQTKYTEYLNNKKEKINSIIKKQESTLHDNNLSLEEIQNRIINGKDNIWIREITNDNFLDIRLGSGDLSAKLDIEAPGEQFFLYDDKLRDEVFDLVNSKKNLTNVPVTISISKNKIVTFILSIPNKQKYIDSLMLQVMYYYSPMDLKIVVLTNDENEEKWDYFKYMPHLWSVKRDRRFFATNDNEYLQISSYLDQIYEKRIKEIEPKEKEESNVVNEKNNLYKNYSEFYLIITDNYKEINNIPIVNRILNSNKNVGFSLLIFGNDIKDLPSKLDRFVDVKNNISGIYSKDLKNTDKSQFKFEYLPNMNIEDYSTRIANIPIFSNQTGYNLPTNLNFLELYHAGKIEHLNIANKWRENDPTLSLFAPIGLKDNGKIIGLDLHEKVHGPHGLIAGSTGSGKSEFIITYVLSMAINYSPKEVQFILIDYKGGGLAGAFENRITGIRIPHLVGTITNLDTSEMNRTLVSLQSELKRRQIKFNEVREKLGEGNIDIYKYQKMYREGKISEPMSHLFVICDEFAELKQQQPDFMSELISTSRIGRSLGVHLILATQKPSGIVDEQIWSNARFRVCLRVQTETDSIEMIRRNDAAMIKEIGRFYLQVGNNELFEYGQSAWAGAKYIPVEHLRNKVDDSISFLNNDGTVLKSVNEVIKVNEDGKEYGEQLSNIVNYLYNLAVNEKIEFKSLWLPSLAKKILFKDLIEKYKFSAEKNVFDAVIGEYDKPSNQLQGLYKVNINSSNTLIFGTPNSGKENFLQNIIYSLCIYHTPNEINFYILDFGSESLGVFNKYPHVGDYITISSKDKIYAEFELLEKEIRKRKELFADYGGSYDVYCKNSGKTVPLIMTIINSYEAFIESCYEYEDTFNRLLREGNKYGIVFATSVISTTSIRNTVQEYYSNKIILQTNEPFDYHFILDAPNGMVPAKNFGRGITIIDNQPCEFQSAVIADDNVITDTIRMLGTKLYNYYKFKVKPIMILPKVIPLNSMFKYAKQINRIPLGYTRDEVQLYYWDFISNKVTNFIGNNVTNDIQYMCSIIDLIDSIKNIKLNIFDFLTCIETDGKASYYNVTFLDVFNQLLENNADQPVINIIIGLGNIFDIFDTDEREKFDLLMNNIDKLNNQTFIIFDNNDRFSKVIDLDWFDNINKNYIWVGKYIDSQNIFDISNISKYDMDDNMDDIVYVIGNNEYKVIKGIGGSE